MKPVGTVPVSVFGAAPDTENLGVSALLFGTLDPLFDRIATLEPTVFDFGRGVRSDAFKLSSHELMVRRCGAQHTKRIYRPEALIRIRVAARLGGLRNPAARLLLLSAAVLDLSGGDSFTDIYGSWRFRAITLPKIISLEIGVPLILLPQTYGPFFDPDHRTTAQMILRRSTLAWARDPRSYDTLKTLLDDDFDPQRHRPGVDVAFLLEARPTPEPLPANLQAMLEDPGVEVAGINVSGLLYNRSDQAARQYGFKSQYGKVVAGLVRRLLAQTQCSVVLVPHVITAEGHYESDRSAALQLADELAGKGNRLIVAPSFDDPRHVKWLISKLDWFCGTRMHSAIAALSSGIPSAALAYSDKTLGVFETCGLGEQVADLRRSNTEDIVEELWHAWQSREESRTRLAAALPEVLGRAQAQMDDLATAITSTADMVES